MGWRASMVAVVLGACGGGGGDGTPIGNFCDIASNAPDCDSASRCEGMFTTGEVLYPRCSALFDQFATCLSSLQLACIQGMDFEIHGTGDGTHYGNSQGAVPGYVIYVEDTACRTIQDDLQSCETCSNAVGYPGGKGVGDRCSASAPCAAGLTCNTGMCTRACAGDEDCFGTRVEPFRCPNELGVDNHCINNQCTAGCSQDNNFCKAYGSTWLCGGGGSICALP